MTRLGSLVMTAALLATLVACSSDEDSPDDELGPRARCVAADSEGELILNPGSLQADQEPWELTGVTLRGAQNLEIVESSAVAWGGQPGLQGIVVDYPPLKKAGIADGNADWDERQQLPVTVSTEDGLQAMLVAVRLVEPGDAGRLTGVTLDYQEAGQTHTLSFTQQVLVEPHDEICTVDDVAATREWTR